MAVSQVLRKGVTKLTGGSGDYANILHAIGNAKVVLIGEETHGTEEFYRFRAELTKRLISEKGFNFVAVEGDWPDTYKINRYVRCGKGCREKSAVDSLSDFQRFPLWMWRNNIVAEFIEWLRKYNLEKPIKSEKLTSCVGLYGLDLYSFFKSADRVISYLDKVDKEDAKKARNRYGTLSQYRGRESDYGFEVAFRLNISHEKEVVDMLVDMLKKGPDYLKNSGGFDGDEYFWATENAHVVKNAEKYYRNSYKGGAVTWNLRDSHMMETLQNLMKFYESQRENPAEETKAVLWAHNSHLGDARATELGSREYNLGQLVRQKYGLHNSYSIGFTTFNGTVRAARTWGDPGEIFSLNDAEEDTYEYIFHTVDPGSNFSVIFRSLSPEIVPKKEVVEALLPAKYERMIGVQYAKKSERISHYAQSCLPKQFDAVVHFDTSSALVPLD